MLEAKMDGIDRLHLARLRAKADANSKDAEVWRWYADLMEENRIVCKCKGRSWDVVVDGVVIASAPSFDAAVRSGERGGRSLTLIDRPASRKKIAT